MHLEQLNLSYLLHEDRILLRIGFADTAAEEANDHKLNKQEIQLFLTRRMLQRMWPTMMEAITSHLRINRPEAAFASSDILNMQHKQAVTAIAESGNFSQAYEADNRQNVTGALPLLLETVKFHLQAKSAFWIQFIPLQGGAVDLKLTPSLLHGFCKLLIDAEKLSGWDLGLHLPESEAMNIPAHLLN
ncbi:MAG: hypothetical protein K2P84_12460 [Undibacterium sp.]|nr:hypothetical protein [Undibacterium sp.]